jgi:hypothetical protein
MPNETIPRDLQLLRVYASGVEKALLTQPVGPARNVMVETLAGVDQKLAELRDRSD